VLDAFAEAASILLISRTADFDTADTERRCTRGENPAPSGLFGHATSPMHGGDWTALQGWALHGNVSQSGASTKELQVDDSHATQQLQVQDACCSSSHRCSTKRPSPANLCIPVLVFGLTTSHDTWSGHFALQTL